MAKKQSVKKALKTRPPIVTLMGHVDHGKTSILDAIRQTDIASREAGGITQHIGASQITISKRRITFIDTPGHEAFTKIRARGGHVADIVVLVVAADEGVKEQTREAINHAKAAKVPIIVAINKTDLPHVNIKKVKEELAKADILVEDWGGDIVCVPVSAKTKEGIKELLEMILLVADLAELKSMIQEDLEATVIEANLDDKKGPMVTVIVTSGSLNISDQVRVGNTFGKVKALINDKGERIKTALPGDPVEILGLKDVPEAGLVLRQVTGDEIKEVIPKSPPSHEILSVDEADGIQVLKIILKADSRGSIDAILGALLKLETEDKRVKLVHSGVGNVSESDVLLAQAAEGLVIGFQVSVNKDVEDLAKYSGVEVKIYQIIYKLIEEIQKVLSLLVEEEKYAGKGLAQVLKMFSLPSGDKVAGVLIKEGKLTQGDKVRVLRKGEEIHQGEIKQLRIKKERIRKVKAGTECGVYLKPQFAFKQDDVIEIIY